MRENMGLFRGRSFRSDKWETKWYYGYLYVERFNGLDGYEIFLPERLFGAEPEWHFVDPETVGEFTGLTDCNGKQIFEGDIVVYGGELFEVYANPTHGTTFFSVDREKNGRTLDGYDCCNYEYEKKKVFVVGNIHDNPELLPGAKKGAEQKNE